jgi:hypothetical protein
MKVIYWYIFCAQLKNQRKNSKINIFGFCFRVAFCIETVHFNFSVTNKNNNLYASWIAIEGLYFLLQDRFHDEQNEITTVNNLKSPLANRGYEYLQW